MRVEFAEGEGWEEGCWRRWAYREESETGKRWWGSDGGYVRVRREGGELWQQGCEEKVGESDYRSWRNASEMGGRGCRWNIDSRERYCVVLSKGLVGVGKISR